jgi:hypothetical protein
MTFPRLQTPRIFLVSTTRIRGAATIIPDAVSKQTKMADGTSIGKMQRTYLAVIFRLEK